MILGRLAKEEVVFYSTVDGVKYKIIYTTGFKTINFMTFTDG